MVPIDWAKPSQASLIALTERSSHLPRTVDAFLEIREHSGEVEHDIFDDICDLVNVTIRSVPAA